MAKNTKRSSEADSRPTSLLFGWTQQGIDSFMTTQQNLADLITRKSADVMNSLREGASDAKYSPGAILTELAVKGTANLAEAQRVLLNLVQQENGILMRGVEERMSGSATAVSVANRLRRSIDTVVEMKQEFLAIANEYVQTRLKEAKAGHGPDTASLVDAARDAMENLLRAQKKLLDIAFEKGAKGSKAEDGGKKKAVSELAQEAASALMDAQKSLLDLAGQQVKANWQTASHAAEMVNSLRLNLMPGITGDGVKGFVDAQKAVVNSIIQSDNGHKKAAKAKSGSKRPARRGRVSAVQAEAASA
jgi:NADH dehydrogenase/NADH:ubiquinone oxidoreductase subunit G